jgi:hypothetical protein
MYTVTDNKFKDYMITGNMFRDYTVIENMFGNYTVRVNIGRKWSLIIDRDYMVIDDVVRDHTDNIAVESIWTNSVVQQCRISTLLCSSRSKAGYGPLSVQHGSIYVFNQGHRLDVSSPQCGELIQGQLWL